MPNASASFTLSDIKAARRAYEADGHFARKPAAQSKGALLLDRQSGQMIALEDAALNHACQALAARAGYDLTGAQITLFATPAQTKKETSSV